MSPTDTAALADLRNEANAIRAQIEALAARAARIEDANADDDEAAAGIRAALEEAAWAIEYECS